MSAFLYFSQDRRKGIKEVNPNLKNTEISRILGEMWKKATDEERAPHIRNEAAERKKYKVKIAEWKSQEAKRKKEAQKKLEEQEAMLVPPPPAPYHNEQPISPSEEPFHVHPEQYHPQRITSESPHPAQPETAPSQRQYYPGYPQEYYHPSPNYGPPPPHYMAYQQPPQQQHPQHHPQPYHPPHHPPGYPYDYGVYEYKQRSDVDDQSRRTQNSAFPEIMDNHNQHFENQAPSSEFTSSNLSPYAAPQPPECHYDNGRPSSVHSFNGDDF